MEKVGYRLEGPVAVLQMDDGKVNALGTELLDELAEALARARAEAPAIVLTGRPGRFCAGFDLRLMLAGPEAAVRLLTQGGTLLMDLYACELPLVVACSGHAIAGGALLVLVGDRRIGASGDFQIGLNEVGQGMPLPILAMELARDRLERRHLTAATLHARMYAPASAVEAGYLDRVVPPEALLDAALEDANALAAHSRSAYAITKANLRGATVRHVRETMGAELARLAQGLGR